MSITRRLWLLTRSHRLALALTVFCGASGGLLIIGQAALISWVVNDVFLGGQGLSAEAGFFRLLIVAVLLRSFFVWGSEASATRLGTGVKTQLRQRLFDALLELGPLYTRGERSGELAGTLFEGVEALGVYFSQYLPQVVLAALVPVSILVVIFPRDWLSGFILLLTAPLIPVFMYLIGKGAETLTRRQWDTLSRLSAYFLDSLQALTTLKLFGQSRRRADAIAETSGQFREITLKVLRVTFLSALVLELVATISTAMVAVEVSLRLLYGHLEFQQAFFLLLLAPEFYLPLRMLGTRFHAGMAGMTAARRIFEILDQPKIMSPARQAAAAEEIPAAPILIEGLSFSYPGEPQPVLENITLEIQPGEHVALTGLTGAGKSTLAALILGFMPPSCGFIGLNGLPLGGLSLDAWRRRIAWVPQNPHLFHDTIAANLRIARPDAGPAELEQAARAAGLDDFIRSLSQGWETVVGEEGARLSGGEAQRLALARAFLKGAPILILDEPTSHLDPQNETRLIDSIHRLMAGRTVLTIAHRPNALIEADRIYHLESGHLIEQDPPDGLGLHTVAERRGLLQASVDLAQPVIGGSVSQSVLNGSSSFVSDDSSTPHSSPVLLRLLSFLQGSWGWVALSVLLGALAIAGNAGLMGTAAYLISAAALHPEFGALQIAVVAVRFFGISRGVFRYTERLVSHDVTFRLLSRLRTWFYQALEPLAPARLMQFRSGDLLSRIIADVETLENFYVRAVAPPFVAFLITAGMCLFLGQYAGSLAWTYFGLMILLGLILPWLAWASSRQLGAALITQRAAVQGRLVDGLHGLAELVAFNAGPDYSQMLAADDRAYAGLQGSLSSRGGLFNALTTLGIHGGVLAILALTIPLVAAGTVRGPMLAALMLAAQAGFEAVLPLSSAAQTLSACAQAGKRILNVVDAEPVVKDAVSLVAIQPRTPFLESSGLRFTYPGDTHPALEGIDFQLKPGHRIAIVGHSGSGKSTLAHLLLRFWDYSTGSIRLNDQELRSYPQEAVRQQFSVAPQQSTFLDDTLLQNILIGDPTAGESEVRRAARRACIDEFIDRLPEGYQTRIGERGLRLSGGEARRLALARAYLKDAPIYLLDEPTVNLDPLTEARILETLLATLVDRSLLLITHRLAGLEHMDEILVLEKGRIVERGTHASLLARVGLYRQMWQLQGTIDREKMVQ